MSIEKKKNTFVLKKLKGREETKEEMKKRLDTLVMIDNIQLSKK